MVCCYAKSLEDRVLPLSPRGKVEENIPGILMAALTSVKRFTATHYRVAASKPTSHHYQGDGRDSNPLSPGPHPGASATSASATVDLGRIELPTSSLQGKHSASLSYRPKSRYRPSVGSDPTVSNSGNTLRTSLYLSV